MSSKPLALQHLAPNLGQISVSRKGVNYFLDEKEIDYGDDIVDQVSKNLTDSTHMAVIISPGSIRSPWVLYEIGFAKANGLKIIPILQHPAIEVPGYIRNLKYCKDLNEFSVYVDGAFEGDLLVDVDVHAGEMIMVGESHIVFALHSVKEDKTAASDAVAPALKVEVKNRMGREIELDKPFLSFKRPQKGIIPDKEIEGLGVPFSLEERHVVFPHAKTTFYFYHPGNVSPSKSLMAGIINAFLTDNIESISIESNDGLKKIIRAESIGNVEEIVDYFRTRFPSYCWDLA